MLECNNITKRFGSTIILDNLSLQAHRGEITVLLGASGAGKSTLLRILNNLETYNSGTIVLDGTPLDVTQAHKKRQVGMVFQQFNLFDNLTVQENIVLPLTLVANTPEDTALKKATALLEHYGLSKQAHAYPQDLSGGQKQRLAIARALALKPEVICLDEPTSALDPLLTGHVAQSLTELANKGLIVLVATHDTSLLEKIDCTIHLLHHGAIIASATTKQISENPEQHQTLANFIKGK